jgi:hypothetical protein
MIPRLNCIAVAGQSWSSLFSPRRRCQASFEPLIVASAQFDGGICDMDVRLEEARVRAPLMNPPPDIHSK